MIGKDDIFGIPIESRELKTYTTGAKGTGTCLIWLIALLLNQFQRMSYEPVTSTLIFEGVDAQIISQLF